MLLTPHHVIPVLAFVNEPCKLDVNCNKAERAVQTSPESFQLRPPFFPQINAALLLGVNQSNAMLSVG